MNRILKINRLLKDNRGYFTVEASFIVPTVLLCIVGILFGALYLYDLGTAESFLTREVVLKSSYPQREEEGKNRLERELQKRLMVSSVDKITLTAGRQKVKGTIRISFRIPIPLLHQMTGALWKNNLTITIDNGNNAEQMRRWDQLE